MSKKLCKKCNQEKDVSEFFVNRRLNDGLFYCCKSCHNEAKKHQGNGYVRGQDHHNAKKAGITDDDVDLIRELSESSNLSLSEIARKFECHKSTIRDIVNYRTRNAR